MLNQYLHDPPKFENFNDNTVIFLEFNVSFTSFFTLVRHRRRRVLSLVIASGRPSVRLSVFPSVRPERRSRSNSFKISGISLTFGGMMHSNMKQIAI